jgi:hypothetical protein
VRSSISPQTESRVGLRGQLGRSASDDTARDSRPPAVVPVLAGPRGRTAGARESTWRHVRAAQARHSEEDRMRLVAALLVLATLLLWILFLQG